MMLDAIIRMTAMRVVPVLVPGTWRNIADKLIGMKEYYCGSYARLSGS